MTVRVRRTFHGQTDIEGPPCGRIVHYANQFNVLQLNSWEFGRKFITLILMLLNSVTLEMKVVQITLSEWN